MCCFGIPIILGGGPAGKTLKQSVTPERKPCLASTHLIYKLTFSAKKINEV